jgi:ribosomal protein S27AE
MPRPRSFGQKKAPVGLRRCPKCGVPMFLACIEPTDQADHNQRTFECSTCAYAEVVAVKYRSHVSLEFDPTD